MTDQIAEWDAIFTKRAWGRWPNTRFVEWAMRKYGGVDDRRAVKFLELGCGAGAQLRFLAAEGFTNVHGMDSSSAAIQQALKVVTSGALSKGDVRTWEPIYGPYDCIIDICCLQHLTHAEAKVVIARAMRWLKPGGYFFCMHAAAGSGLDVDAPLPYLLDAGQIEDTFAGYAVNFGLESVRRPSGMDSRHFIIEARKD